MIGTNISHYRILEKLGEGGMGIVYKAQDTKLDRLVALKFLPPHLSASQQDKARFIQEAKAASAMNHPNICTIYAIDEHDGPASAGVPEGRQLFIAMEFVDGQTLRQKLESGGISQKAALEIGIQIADGLAAAHEKGIIHRDIKPENIMIRKDGIAQVMDFGLAKLKGAAGVSRLTKEGSTVGTAGYMSPEQVQGQDADHRSDIFSLGAVLYELFTGYLPFKGVHETALAYEIVNVDPAPMSAVKPDIDPNLDAIVLECLAKELDERTQSAKQVSADLKRYRRESSRSRASRITAARPMYQPAPVSGEHIPATAATARKTALLPWAVAGLFFLGMIVLAFLYLRGAAGEAGVFRFMITPPEHAMFVGEIPIISPDGQRLAFVARDSGGAPLIWVRPLSSLTPTPLSGTAEATYPFWSPDSRFLGFFQNGKLRKIEATGGPPQTIADAPSGRGGAWSSAGIIVFSPSFGGGLVQVPQAGGTPTELTTLDSAGREDSHRWPSFLPDGRQFVYFSQTTPQENGGIFLSSLDSKEKKLLLRVVSNAIVTSSGHLLFVRERSLMAQPFNTDKGELSGDAFPLAEDIGFEQSRNYALFSASTNGVLAFGMGVGTGGNRQLAWYDRSGKRLDKVGTAGFVFDFSLSPDEKRVAFRRFDGQTKNQDIWVLDILRGTESRLTFRPVVDDDPVWSPDGSRIVYDSSPDGVTKLHQKIASGAGSDELLLKSTTADYPLDWSSDGRYILFGREDPKTRTDLWILPLSGDMKPYAYVNTDAVELSGRFSPDGRWIAYSSDESGKFEVYVQAFPVTQGKWQVSVGGGAAPIWSRDGKEIYYLASDKKLMAVDVRAVGASLDQGVPKPLFATDVDGYFLPNRYAVSKDGKRFLVNNGMEAAGTKPVAIVLNWTADIKGK